MRRLMLFAALAASMLCHGEENNVDWWFTPQKWVDSEEIEIQLTKADGTPVGPITVNHSHSVATIAAAIEKKLDEKGSAPQAYALSTKALAQAIVARLENKRQDEKILTLAKSIDVTLLGDTYSYVDSEGNKIEMRRTADYDKVKDLILQNRQFVTGSKPSNEDNPIEIKLNNSIFDKNMLECVATPECKEGDKLWTLKGFYSADKLKNFWTCENNSKYYAIPMFEGNNGHLTGSLNWHYFGGIDLCSLYSSTNEQDPMYNKLTLRGWNETKVLDTTLSTLLTSKASADRDEAISLSILVRKSAVNGDSIKNTLEYVELGDVIDSVGLDCEPEQSLLDGFPIYTNNVDGVVKLGLRNWETLDNATGVYGKKEGGPVMWRMDDSKSLECDTTYDTIEIKNSVAAKNRAIPFKDKSNPDGDTISWLAPPSENTSGKYLKMTGTGDNATLSWESAAAGGVLLVEGNDGSSAICTNTLKFASAGDSNIKFNVTQDNVGNVTVTIGVYYLQESNLNGSSGGGL